VQLAKPRNSSDEARKSQLPLRQTDIHRETLERRTAMRSRVDRMSPMVVLPRRNDGRSARHPTSKVQGQRKRPRGQRRLRPKPRQPCGTGSNKTSPPESTNAENFYYLKQMSARTPMVITLTDGEEIRGWIEWYDKTCLKVNRTGAPNLLIQKHCIKYMCKQEEEAP